MSPILSIILILIFIMFLFCLEKMYLLMSFENLLKNYHYKIKLRKKILLVIVLHEDEKLSNWTIKSLLNQTCRVDDIFVETSFPKKINSRLRKIVTVHFHDTIKINETDSRTVIIPIDNGRIYNKNFVLNYIGDCTGGEATL